jgi:hypothetical protein
MPPGWYMTEAAKMPKCAGYSALQDRSAARMARVRTRASGNVLCTSLGLGNKHDRKQNFRLKRDVIVQVVHRPLLVPSGAL